MKYTVVMEGVGHCGMVQRSIERAETINRNYFKGRGKIVEVSGRKALANVEGGVVAPKISGSKGKTQPQPAASGVAKLFTVSQRFDMMNTITSMVVRSAHKSMFVAGNGGTGKTMTVLNALEANGMRRVDMCGLDDDSDLFVDDSKAYIRVTGATSPVGLYRLLYENRNSLIVFDDCDGFLKNENAVNILKSVLDTTGDGTVSWRSPFMEQKGLPETFTFKGRVVFISNLTLDSVPQPIVSRALIVDMTLDTKEIIERARMLDDVLLPKLNKKQRAELLDFVEENASKMKSVSLRTFVLAEPYVAENLENWRELTLFTA